MSVSDSGELKRKLRAEGFEIYRSAESAVQLAERVRDNLIMDSGVAALLVDDSRLAIEVTVRAQASHFPGANEEQMWAHARALAGEFLSKGYREEEAQAAPVPDPSDPTASLDTAHEIRLRRDVPSLQALCEELRQALSRRRSTYDD